MNEPLKMSVSKSKCWDQCKKRYEFQYILKLPRKEADYHIVGHLLHKVLEDFHQAYIKGSTAPYNEVMKRAWKAAKIQYSPKLKAEAVKECYDMLASYLDWLSKQSSDFCRKILTTEEAFSFPLTDKVILNGFIDRVGVDYDGVLHIADYKSTKNKKYLKDDWTQLLTYAFVILNKRPDIDRVRVSYILLRHDFEHMSREVSRAEAMEVKQLYLDAARDIETTTTYEASPSPLCRTCDFLQECAVGKKTVFSEATYGETNW
jgi:ATP-dependent helicase/DNAse subunit B